MWAKQFRKRICKCCSSEVFGRGQGYGTIIAKGLENKVFSPEYVLVFMNIVYFNIVHNLVAQHLSEGAHPLTDLNSGPTVGDPLVRHFLSPGRKYRLPY